MSSKKLGSDYRLFIQTSVAATFVQPGGQGNLTINRSKSFSSNATKDTEGVDTQSPGLRSISLTQAITPVLPDPEGYTRMETLDKSNASEVYQIRKKPFATGDVVFECLMVTGLDNTGLEQGSAVSAGVVLQPAAQPTVDTLS